MNTLDEILEVVAAAKNKKPIRYRRWWPEQEETWHPGITENPLFNFAEYEFQVTPEPIPPGDLTEEEAEAEYRKGAVIQWAYPGSSDWRATGAEKCGPFLPGLAYRRKPEPRMVPLCSRDVRAGDQIRDIGFTGGWAAVTGARDSGSCEGLGVLGEHGWKIIPWDELKRDCEISHDGGATWARAEKPEGGK